MRLDEQHDDSHPTARAARWPQTVLRNQSITAGLRQFAEIVCCVMAVLAEPSTLLRAQESAQSAADAARHENEILTILRSKCVRCHGGEAPKAELDLSSTNGLFRGGESGAVVVPGKPGESLLYEKVRDGEMPPEKKDPLTDKELEALRRWIESGDRSRAGTASGSAAATVTQHDVVPILLRRCTTCHGARRQEASLDLRSTAGMLRGGKSGPAIVPGQPDESLLVKKILAGDMPPRDRLVEASVKPIEPAECEVIARWIAGGAPEVAVEPDVATASDDPLVTDQDREFWAFQPPRRVAVPPVSDAAQIRNPIDAFVLDKLTANGLTLSSDASRATLLRRASLDLTGVPPDPDEVEAFLADQAPDAYEKMIDRLLDSPRYGERWARIWLDVAGYADSEGKREQDLPRPHAWRYRDYVIRSLNADKPYDRFLMEQLAGDELVDCEHAPEITQEIYDNLVATGFLRMAPDATWANITGYVDDRLEVIADEIDVLGSAVMGLTLKCARCHSHKFDPIPQRDYYRLAAIFKGAFDENDWLKPDVRPGVGPLSQDILPARHLPHVTTAERRAWEENNLRIERSIGESKSALDRQAETLRGKYLEERMAQLPEALRADLRAMLTTAADKRDAVQAYLAEKFEAHLRINDERLQSLDSAYKALSEETARQVKALEAQRTPEPSIHALWDRGEPSPTYIYRRGESQNPGRLVGPGVPSVLTDGRTPFDVQPPWQGAKATGRRLAFARWLVRPDHPLTARVMVNRLWKHHFGTGIVKTLGNFGKAGSPPTHPALLDWLAVQFVERGWSQKAVHRLMMTSATYRQASTVTSAHEKLDAENALYSRMPLVRLDAEQLYDALLAVAGRLDETRFGPGDAVQLRADGLLTPVGTERGWRRLIYVNQMRKQIPTHLENFDYPQMNPNCVERRDSTVAPQALHLLNNGMVRQLAEQFAARVAREAGTDPAKQIDRVSLIALARRPSDEERSVGLDALVRLRQESARHATPSDASTPVPDEASREALTTFCHAIMNSAAFLYVD
jgi:mono/diheme cytochrome c family protein